jgi:hypothetical protein
VGVSGVSHVKKRFCFCNFKNWLQYVQKIDFCIFEILQVGARPVYALSFSNSAEKHPDAAASWGAARSHSVLGAAMALQFVCAEIQNEDDAETSSCVAALDPRPQTHDFIATTMSVSVQTADQPEKNKMPDAPKQDA